jgi:hypothetical protein
LVFFKCSFARENIAARFMAQTPHSGTADSDGRPGAEGDPDYRSDLLPQETGFAAGVIQNIKRRTKSRLCSG